VFQITHRSLSCNARTGIIATAHGDIATPAFLFCATQGTLKGLSSETLLQHNVPILLANTYHLMLKPGSERIRDLGGLHTFMGWKRPIFTDSGGYQIFSLGHGSVSEEIKGQRHQRAGNSAPKSLVKVTEEGALFTSHHDGSRHALTPERSIEVQCHLGSDIMCVLDECTPYHISKENTAHSLALSHRWALRSLHAFQTLRQPHQALYGIVQGGVYPDLRQESAEWISALPFSGHAIGGSLGTTKTQMQEVIDMALQSLSRDKPIHLLGIGGIRDIFSAVTKGIDTFDCVSPTRLGRHGGGIIKQHYWDDAKESFHPREHINLWKACFQDDPRPIDITCLCSTCKSYSRAYLHHLLKAKELLALSALSLHNVSMMNRLMQEIRQGIFSDTLKQVQAAWISTS
jgi:queuine tRNA-ribosyltransferase